MTLVKSTEYLFKACILYIGLKKLCISESNYLPFVLKRMKIIHATEVWQQNISTQVHCDGWWCQVCCLIFMQEINKVNGDQWEHEHVAQWPPHAHFHVSHLRCTTQDALICQKVSFPLLWTPWGPTVHDSSIYILYGYCMYVCKGVIIVCCWFSTAWHQCCKMKTHRRCTDWWW